MTKPKFKIGDTVGFVCLPGIKGIVKQVCDKGGQLEYQVGYFSNGEYHDPWFIAGELAGGVE